MASKQTNGSVRINNTQRKALVELAGQKYGRLIQQASDKCGEIAEQITDEVKRELGVLAIEKQIEEFENKVDFLKLTKKKLGFADYHIDGKARKLIDQRKRKANKEAEALEKQRDEAIIKIWTSETIQEAESILKDISSGSASKGGVV